MNVVKKIVTCLCITFSVATFTAHGAASGASQSKFIGTSRIEHILSDLRNTLLQGGTVNATEFAQLAPYKIFPNEKLIPNSSDTRTLFSAFILTQKVGDYASIACHLTDAQLDDEIVLLKSLSQFHTWYRKNQDLLKLRHHDLQALARLQKKALKEQGSDVVRTPCYAEQLQYARVCLKKDHAEPDLRVTEKLIAIGDAK